jgi:hypothetical protein
VSRDRDHIVEQALKQELRGVDASDTCIDAETLAAWTDDALDAAAMAATEAHVSNCARCQAVVGAMVRGTSSTLDAPGTLGTPDTVTTEGTLSLWRWWLAPIAAGVTAVTLWMVVPEKQQQIASAPQAKASAEIQPVAPAEGQPPPRTAVAPSAPPAAIGAAPPPAARDNLAAAARDDRAQKAVAEERKEEAPQRQLQERSAMADAAAAPPAPATVAMEAPAIGALQKSARESGGVIEVPSLQRSRRWRIIPRDRVERTDDGGTTWTVVTQVPPGEAIVAGSAPMVSVCWLAGTRGLVLITNDAGASFTDVSLAEPLDIASISATDGNTAIISTVGGRRFRTGDGGRTWQPF